jgi:hypothetical protein
MYKPSEEEIKALKAKHGDIFLLNIEDKACILKKPSRKVLSYATSVAAKDPMKFNEIMLNDCFVAGDEEIKTDDSYFLAAASKISDLIEVKESELVKL